VSSPRRPNLDSLTTINRDGSRYFLHPADVGGRFTRARRLFGILLLAIYAGLPWIHINGTRAVFMDVANRRFHFFGLHLVPQDLWVLFFAISGLGFTLFLVTALLGRLWCGWACPYTVLLEQVFRRIERWIDGDAAARRKLDAAPMRGRKLVKRVAKHTLYLISATLIAHVFLAYFVSLPGVYSPVLDRKPPALIPLGVAVFLTGALFFCFAWFREQFCIILCPYGRLQSAITDEDSLIIGYDAARGEPRGKATLTGIGACVDCRRCVQVCPTGIDIRNGLQMECVGCAACIDACDDIMDKLRRPRGLIRYDSANGLAGKPKRILRPSIYAYAALGFAGVLALGVTTFFRAKPITTEVSRVRGASFFDDSTSVRNLFQLRLVNKRNQPATFHISLEGAPEAFTTSGASEPLELSPLQEETRTLVVIIPRADYRGPQDLTVRIEATPGDATRRHTVRFLGPRPDTHAP
jgi:cytochrome c oxidase accessory protein FixG